ncbi:hypothetical protein CP533_4018 [Ophiocordyceps camponoti-saundersi (nom. inval.)]|nr:hypothetical protein CP533_4018 [Ophiocordyceps camponoti-saundersi (nom. inval.)]
MQLGRGVYTTPYLNGWLDAGWQCAIFADKEKFKTIPKIIVSRRLYQETRQHDPTLEIHAYIRNLYKDIDPRRCLLLGYIDDGPELQMLIPFSLLNANQGGLNITVECASSRNMDALRKKVDVMLDHSVRVNYSSWEGVHGDLSDIEDDYDYTYDTVKSKSSDEETESNFKFLIPDACVREVYNDNPLSAFYTAFMALKTDDNKSLNHICPDASETLHAPRDCVEMTAYYSMTPENQDKICSTNESSEEIAEPDEYCNLGEHTSHALERRFLDAFVQGQRRSIDQLQDMYPVIAVPLLALLSLGICLPHEHRIRRETDNRQMEKQASPSNAAGGDTTLQCCRLGQELMGFLVSEDPGLLLDDYEAKNRIRELALVVDVRINNIDNEDPGELYGSITVIDPVGARTIYDIPRESAQDISPGGLMKLSDGERVIEASEPFSIRVNLWDRDRVSSDDLISEGLILWRLDDPHNQIFSTELSGDAGSATIRWAVLGSAVAASIKVILIDGDGESPANIYGTCDLKTEYLQRTWFKVKKDGNFEVYPGNLITGTETTVAVGIDDILQIRVDIWDYDTFSSPDAVARGMINFYPNPAKIETKRVKGDRGEVEIEVSWTSFPTSIMDQRELEARIKALTKSVAANEPPENAIRLLDMLKKDAAPTEEMLRATRAGVFVGKLRGNPNKEIARAAMELVNKWKKLVEQEKNSKLQKAKMGSPALPSASPPSSAPPASSGARKAFTGDPEKRKYDSDGVDIKRTASNVRNQCIGLVYNGLAFRSTESPSDVIAKSVAVEQAVFDSFGSENAEYKKKIRSLFANLKNKSNKELGRRVMNGDITPDRFASMTDDDLKSEDQRKKDLELEKENMKKAQVPMAEKSISDSLECGRCKKKRVSYTQAQTRAADEPMTTFCECMNCGHRWKVYEPLSGVQSVIPGMPWLMFQ